MPTIIRHSACYDVRPGESVLDALLRQGADVPFSCRNGICQVCLQRCVRGAPSDDAQRGLRAALRAKGYFLPCRCVAAADMEIAAPRAQDLFCSAFVHSKQVVAPDVCIVQLEPSASLNYRAGQFINLRRPDGLTRSYSLASLPQEDELLELHVRRMPGGAMSGWIFDDLSPGEEVEIQGPEGYAYYTPGRPQKNMLLVGTGTGLAPLLGIVRDALKSGHEGEIHLYHGSRDTDGAYQRDRLCALSARHHNLRVAMCVEQPGAGFGFLEGRAHVIAFGRHLDLSGWRVHLAGPPAMVEEAQAMSLRAGGDDVHCDPFVLKDLRRAPRAGTGAGPAVRSRGTDPAPDPEMWSALDGGARLTAILTDFYTRVFEDEQLAPYFRGVTRQRLIEKVYSFMRQVFTGERIYFGDRPRNAHHWMVISDGLFDHREALMASCLRRHGLPEHLISRWRAVEEHYRPEIVKTAAWPRIVGGQELPLDGFGEAVLDVGTLCDGCGEPIDSGQRVRYHLRLGSTYCRECTHAEKDRKVRRG